MMGFAASSDMRPIWPLYPSYRPLHGIDHLAWMNLARQVFKSGAGVPAGQDGVRVK
jgi:hypothetical protein